MKKRAAILAAAVMVLLIICAVWYRTPMNLMDLDPDEVLEIVVFNGGTGTVTHIGDTNQIATIIDALNEVTVKRGKPSAGYSGFSFKITIYLSDGNQADDWNNFIINSNDTIQKDPFFYTVAEGSLPYDYIAGIAD